MPSRRSVILVTGFGPFPGVPANATARLVPALAERARRAIPGHTVVAEILPTEWHAAPLRLATLLAEWKPVASVHFGVSYRAEGFVIEQRGRNVRDHVADACGALPGGECIADDGPEFLASTFPSSLIVERLRRRGLPAMLSRDAGGYLCNALLYHALHHGRGRGLALRSGFVHLPDGLGGPLAGGRRAIGGRGLDWNGAIEGGLEILATAAGRSSTHIHE